MDTEPLWDRAGKIVLPGRSMVRIFFVVLLVFAGMLIMAERGSALMHVPLAASVLALLFFGVQLLPGANRLEITREGFTCVLVFCRYPTSWEDVDLIAVDELGNVVWNYAPHVVHESRKARSVRIARASSGFDACLPSLFGQSAPMLAALMNRIREEKTG